MRSERHPSASGAAYIEDAERAAHGRNIGAFFDLDRTLIRGYSAVALIHEHVRHVPPPLRGNRQFKRGFSHHRY
jgi:hypothetical protein